MISLLLSIALGLLEIAINFGMMCAVVWAIWTRQIQGGPKKLAGFVCCLASAALVLRICGVKP